MRGAGAQQRPEHQTTRRRVGTAEFYSPLRYPGGKRKLAPFLALTIRMNRLMDGDYAEVYAGGSAVALSLLYGEYVRRVHINDLDRGVFAFWSSARDQTSQLCRLIRSMPLSVAEWERQRAVQFEADPDPLELGLSTFYLNRTNRSGIIRGGIIGGKNQDGPWKLDARFNRDKLVKRIERIGRNRSRIELYRLDGADFLQTVAADLPQRSFLYLDPPYYVKGQQELYANYYGPADHAAVARLVAGSSLPWMVSYDEIDEIRELYQPFRSIAYSISYSANQRYRGREIAFFSDQLLLPDVSNPSRITPAELRLAGL